MRNQRNLWVRQWGTEKFALTDLSVGLKQPHLEISFLTTKDRIEMKWEYNKGIKTVYSSVSPSSLAKKSFFEACPFRPFLARILCLMNPSLASCPMTEEEASVTSWMALSTACVWQGYAGTSNGLSFRDVNCSLVMVSVKGGSARSPSQSTPCMFLLWSWFWGGCTFEP